MKNKEKYSGMHCSFCNFKIRFWKIILQKKVLIEKNETEKSLKLKVLKQEHKLYSEINNFNF